MQIPDWVHHFHVPIWGEATRQEAEELLKSHQTSCYLLRPSSQQGCIACTVYDHDQLTITHFLIKALQTPMGTQFLLENPSVTNSPTFTDPAALLLHSPEVNTLPHLLPPNQPPPPPPIDDSDSHSTLSAQSDYAPVNNIVQNNSPKLTPSLATRTHDNESTYSPMISPKPRSAHQNLNKAESFLNSETSSVSSGTGTEFRKPKKIGATNLDSIGIQMTGMGSISDKEAEKRKGILGLFKKH